MKIISGSDYLKYMTQQVVAYLELPSSERKERRKVQKLKRPLYTSRWLGIIPFALKVFMRKT
ncbi:YqzE family protein [Virgibacillus sp. C22-A2]|uniref:YqzE family protein n=1 Tax=Virgibacillus tibetensis TaxID=3042313 RepID=A0ABU6KCL9_9BACI|nr:YqzE family protein [Virgibacillus sp. C22-A2]